MHVRTRAARLAETTILLASITFLPRVMQAQAPEGDLAGVVEDTSGARVPSARIVVQFVDTAEQREATSDDQGEFRLDYLRPGVYHMSVNAPGLAEARSDVEVVVSSVRAVTVTLGPAGLQQTVNVQGQASSITTQPIDITSSVHEGAVSRQDLDAIPLAARSFANIAYLVPGTEPVEPSDPTKARITAVSFGGSSGLNVQLSVDGADNSDDYIGGFLQSFSPDVIEEFAVSTAQENADTGRATAGAVVITTKRGTDQWHGNAALYDRQAALNARFPIDNPAPNPKQPFSRQNYIGTLGGPLQKSKLWFFSSLEYVHEDASIAYSPASQAQFNALASLAAQGLIPGVNSIAVPSSIPVPFRDVLASTRFDWSQSSRSQWFLRTSADSYLTHNDLVQQGALPSTGATSHSNYFNSVLSNQFTFSPTWLGSLVLGSSYLHHTEARSDNLGFALAFPFSATSSTISGFETFGDNQFVTPITAFPVLRNQEKYQVRYDASHATGRQAVRFGVDFIHEPVLSGALAATAENLTVFALDPADYVGSPAQFSVDLTCTPTPALSVTPGTTCTSTPAGNGSFSQNVQRLGLYAQNSWRATPRLTLNYGVRYDTSFGLFTASGRTQAQNPAFLTLQALQIHVNNVAPTDYRGAIAPRLGVVYSPGKTGSTVLRAGFGLFYNDLAQNGWVTALQAVNEAPAHCATPGDPGCLPGGSPAALMDGRYRTPYALHATGGVEHAFSSNWMLSAEYTHEQGVHSFARYQYQAGYTLFSPLFPSDLADQEANVPNLTLFRSDNRSRYDGMSVHLQGNVTSRANLIVNYTLSKAKTWGCVLGELFDYVDGVCDPLHAFGPGDFGPSGEDVTHRLVVAGIFHTPGGFELSLLSQAESARPITLTTPVDVNGFGDTLDDRAVINGVQTTLDQFRCTPYIQVDLRVARPFKFQERWSVMPFIEFFNLFNRNNPGANYVTSISALPTPVNSLYNATALCLNADCSNTTPITNLKQILVPSGALGDFFGPGTTVGIPFAAQLGVRVTF
ncbi:MAG TPA: TonB-dependent receptor [Terriglobia bacterium]|nr:TonB-dependent receptor [Terriglobia bacterium]